MYHTDTFAQRYLLYLRRSSVDPEGEGLAITGSEDVIYDDQHVLEKKDCAHDAVRAHDAINTPALPLTEK